MSFMKITEIASIMRVSTATVRRLIAAGTIPAVKVGSQARVDSVDFARYLKSKSVVNDANAN